MSKKSTSSTGLLAAISSAELHDPHGKLESEAEKGGGVAEAKPPQPKLTKAAPKKKASAKKTTVKPKQSGAVEPGRQSERSAVMYSPRAQDALVIIQDAIRNECGVRNPTQSACVCVALTILADELPRLKEKLKAEVEQRISEDGRKRKSNSV